MNISDHITLEQAVHSDTATRLKIDNSTNDPSIIQCMKDVAAACFEPIKKQFPDAVVNSFYRCPILNKSIGGQPTSQHQRGQAIDIGSSSRAMNLEILNWAKTNLKHDQILNEFPDANGCPAWVHISYVLPIEKNRNEFFVIK